MKLSDIIGKQIFSPEGEGIGYVKGACVSREGARLTAFDCSDEEEETFYLPIRAVRAVNDVVIAQKKKSQSFTGIPFPVGKTAYSHLGESAGVIVDLLVQEQTQLVLRDGQNELLVPAAAVSFGKTVIVYPNEEARALAREKKKRVKKERSPSVRGEEPTAECPQDGSVAKTPSVDGENAREGTFPLHRLDLLGRTLKRSVYDAQGYLLFPEGERITPAVIMRARRCNRLLQLAVNTITNI